VDRNHMRAVQPRGRMGFTTEPLERLHLIGMLCEDVVDSYSERYLSPLTVTGL
jgi:hypothetical protein